MHVLRRFTLIYLFIFLSGICQAQTDTSVFMPGTWRISDNGEKSDVLPDTLFDFFEVYNPVYKNSISNSYLGNIGLSSISNIFLQQSRMTGFIFFRPYETYALFHKNCTFYNVRKPFTSIMYTNGAKKEQTLQLLHSQNVNKFLNVGFKYALLSSPGHYDLQQAKDHSFNAFSSFETERYSFHTSLSYNKFSALENGGISNDADFEDSTLNSLYINVNLPEAKTITRYSEIFAVQEYKLGNRTGGTDSTKGTFNHSNSIIHTVCYQNGYRLYTDKNPLSGYYHGVKVDSVIRDKWDPWKTKDTLVYIDSLIPIFADSAITKDSAFFESTSNSLQWRLKEDLERFIKPGMCLKITNTINKYYFNDTITPTYYLHNTTVKVFNYLSLGFFNNARQNIKWWLEGNICVDGYEKGSYYAKGDIKKYFLGNSGRIKKDESTDSLSTDTIILSDGKPCLSLTASFSRRTPDFFEQNYFSNHFYWDRIFLKKDETFIRLEYTRPAWFISVGINAGIFDNYIYYDTIAYPQQTTNTFNVYSAYITKDFNVWKFHSAFRFIYQTTDNNYIVRIPKYIFFNSTFIEQKVFKKILTARLGFNIYYNSAFYGYAYMPATGQFYLQNEKMIGNYPYIDVFLNLKLKRARFFLKAEHVNAGLMGNTYYTVPHYPMNGLSIKFGIAWNFYD